MPLSEEVLEELEALEAIFGADALDRVGNDSIKLRICPQPDGDTHVFGSATLHVTFPPTYPVDSGPILSVSAISQIHEESLKKLQACVVQAALDGQGGVVIFSVAEEMRAWLQEHTKTAVAPLASPTLEASEQDDLDDFDVDSEDLDNELIEALQQILKGDGQRNLELRRIKKLFGKEQRTALRCLLRNMTPAQREELVGSSDEEDLPRGKAKIQLPPASIQCPNGHVLTAYSSRPPDYRKMDDGDYTCDVCGQDGAYKRGVYHCTKCFAQGGKEFDACPSCGMGSSSSKDAAKKHKPKGKKK